MCGRSSPSFNRAEFAIGRNAHRGMWKIPVSSRALSKRAQEGLYPDRIQRYVLWQLAVKITPAPDETSARPTPPSSMEATICPATMNGPDHKPADMKIRA
jgi:hypothetical protein